MNMKRTPNLKLLIGLPLLVIAFGALTVILLNRFVPHAPSATTVVIPEPADIIKQYQATDAVGELSSLYTKVEKPQAGLSLIIYTANDSYTIYAPATDFIQFELKDKTAKTNAVSVKNNSEAFLLKMNLLKIPTSDSKASALATIFDSDKTTCQLVDLPPFSGTSALLGLACIKKSVLNDQYTAINKLLALYGDKQPDIAHPANIRLSTIKEGNKTLSTTDIYGIGPNKGAVTLIFAAIDDKWEYIGQRPLSTGTTATNSNSVDRTPSGSLKTKINDPKYNGFLKKYVQ